MYIFVGLPLDKEMSEEELLIYIRMSKIEYTEILSVPTFPIVQFDNLLTIADTLESLAKSAESTFLEFIKQLSSFKDKDQITIESHSIDYAIKTFKWSANKYEVEDLNCIIEDLTKDYNFFKMSFENRKASYEKFLRQCDTASKIIKGSIKDMELCIEEHEFLVEHYIIVPKNKKEAFIEDIIKIDKISHETLEATVNDQDDILYKIYGLKSTEQEFIDEITELGYFYKRGFSEEEFKRRKAEKEKVLQEKGIQRNNLSIYYSTNINEIFSIMMHIKMLRLYIESVLTYGIGTMIFFVTMGKESKIEREWRKIVGDWKFSRRLEKQDSSKVEFAHSFFENPFVDEKDE